MVPPEDTQTSSFSSFGTINTPSPEICSESDTIYTRALSC
uniref:Uncharacterized protein n=1 Tax=Podoviridae sp. ct8Lf7 TaxID=2827723 RepID=A0A8S5S100_9CAUD|nr:MAG TPA: hypothetical protein [Podoviridae sp. ct8Lf7]